MSLSMPKHTLLRILDRVIKDMDPDEIRMNQDPLIRHYARLCDEHGWEEPETERTRTKPTNNNIIYLDFSKETL